MSFCLAAWPECRGLYLAIQDCSDAALWAWHDATGRGPEERAPDARKALSVMASLATVALRGNPDLDHALAEAARGQNWALGGEASRHASHAVIRAAELILAGSHDRLTFLDLCRLRCGARAEAILAARAKAKGDWFLARVRHRAGLATPSPQPPGEGCFRAPRRHQALVASVEVATCVVDATGALLTLQGSQHSDDDCAAWLSMLASSLVVGEDALHDTDAGLFFVGIRNRLGGRDDLRPSAHHAVLRWCRNVLDLLNRVCRKEGVSVRKILASDLTGDQWKQFRRSCRTLDAIDSPRRVLDGMTAEMAEVIHRRPRPRSGARDKPWPQVPPCGSDGATECPRSGPAAGAQRQGRRADKRAGAATSRSADHHLSKKAIAKILKALKGRCLSGREIADETGYTCDYARHILAGLLNRGILAHDERGYFVPSDS